ncbi:MAG: methylamine utilization protein [Sulfuritalea sp.]|jgi:plastocyanin|nr:methylamine utilization protein [Sulfuritalea sp.]
MADRAGHQTGRLTPRLALAALVLGWACSAGAASLTLRVRTPAGTPVEDAAVVLDPVNGTPPQSHGRATIEQRDRDFVPYLTIVQKGTAVDFPNRDPFKHHVYSFSPAKVFEIKLYAGKPANPVVFDQPGEVALGCNIHDWMEAHVLVVDTPWFAKTGADGVARIDRVPPGAYRLRLWHPRQKGAAADIEVDLRRASRHLDLKLEVAPRVIVKKPPLDAGGY